MQHGDTDCDTNFNTDANDHTDGNCDTDATTGAGAEDKDNIDHLDTSTGTQPQDPRVNFRCVERLQGAFPPRQW
jgi:hypothetical protein